LTDRTLPPPVDLDTLVRIFNDLFYRDYNTLLKGGGEEPLYRPSVKPGDPHEIVFKGDFSASALHEIAHWCIAGASRRTLEDYGYWYDPARNGTEQARFQSVERSPQALEWIFSVAAGRPFRVSFDNLDDPVHGRDAFRRAIRDAVHDYLARGLPRRAGRFAGAVAAHRGTAGDFCATDHYNGLPR
jgi:elongation factor P hydroxylase